MTNIEHKKRKNDKKEKKVVTLSTIHCVAMRFFQLKIFYGAHG